MDKRGEIIFGDSAPRVWVRAARRLRRFALPALAVTLAAVALIAFAPGHGAAPAPTTVRQPLPDLHAGLGEPAMGADGRLAYPYEPLVERGADSHGPSADNPGPDWTVVTVAAGENLSIIFTRHGLSGRDLHAVLALGEKTDTLKRLMPGQRVMFRNDGPALEELIYEEDLLHELHVKRTAEGFAATEIVTEPERRVITATGTIESSLFLAGQNAGLSDAMILKMADIFGWDIDFVLDLREGDRFSVIFEEFYRDGRKARDGDILAAEFSNAGSTYRAVRYADVTGRVDYYSERGNAMRRAFLRTPLNFTRISSNFNLARRHPILNTIRAHRGVDYAAPFGTPVKATGDAKVASIGFHSGYGNVVVLAHNGTYSTAYAHLSRFARGLRQGMTVRQGQTIGYVGSTGLATGPHLHYEFRVNGAHQNPLTVKLPKSLPIPAQYKQDFLAKARPLLAELDRIAPSPDGGHQAVRAVAAVDRRGSEKRIR